MPRIIMIVNYDSQWPILFDKEKSRVLNAIGHIVLAVEHIGSTAVPGLGAKPIIDLMVGVQGHAEADQCIPMLQEIGYTSFTLQPQVLDHYYCCGKGPHSVGYHLHLIKFKSYEWDRHLLFRDYLRAHSDIAQQYFELKKKLSAKYYSDRVSYTEAKTAFIESIITKASSGMSG